jgi:hypothetical protein
VLDLLQMENKLCHKLVPTTQAFKTSFNGATYRPRSAGWWLVLICCERKILVAGWWLMAGAEMM